MLFTNERETSCRCVFFSPKPKTSSVPRRTGGYHFRKSTPKKQDAHLSRFTASLWPEKARSWRWQAQRYNRRPKSCWTKLELKIASEELIANVEAFLRWGLGIVQLLALRRSPMLPFALYFPYIAYPRSPIPQPLKVSSVGLVARG